MYTVHVCGTYCSIDYLVVAIFFRVLLASFLENLAASPFLPIVQLLLALLIMAIQSVRYLKKKKSYLTKLHP